MESREDRIRRLKFQSSKRGLLEAELVLRPYADKHLCELNDAELENYERLLALEDLDLWEVISGRRQAPSNIDPRLISQIQAFLPAGLRTKNN